MTESRPVLRIIPELRNYHVVNDVDNAPSETYFFERKYDLTDVTPNNIQQISFRGALRLVMSQRFSQLVIWEPLWVRLLPMHMILAISWKLATLRKRPVLSYAMENNDLASLMGGTRRIPGFIVRAFSLMIGAYIRFAYTRLVFASDGARIAYQTLPGVTSVPHVTIPNLPGVKPLRRPCGTHGSVIMVARMERRKGTAVIMKSWPMVEARNSEAHLTVIGSGPESDMVAEWAAESPSTRTYLGARNHAETLERIAEASVLVLPSVRDGRWREQIGLPIHEGLTNGLTVVTTDETGLADLLAAHGHHVVASRDVESGISAAILRAIVEPIERTRVQRLLPPIDGRIAADMWLTGGAR